MIIAAPYRKILRPEDVPFHNTVIRYLATRRWDRRGGWVMVAGGLLTAILRLTS